MADVALAPIWFSTNALLAWAAWVVIRWLFPNEWPLQNVMHVVILCWACIVAAATLLGVLGILTWYGLLLMVSAISGSVLLLTRRKPAAWFPSPNSLGRGRVIGEVQRATTAGVRPLDSGKRLVAGQQSPREGWWLAVWGLLLAFWLVRIILDGFLAFPTDWDSLAYHIPLVNQWLHAKSLYAPDCAFWYSPGNNELLGLWFVAPFSGDFLISLNNVPAAILLAASAVEFSAGVCLPRSLCHLTGLLIVANQPVVRQLISEENDLAVAGLFLTALFYGHRYARHARRADAVFAALSLGLLSGVKYYALGYVGTAAIGLFMLLVAWRGSRIAIRATLLGFLGMLLLGGYWYLRNLIMTGAPLYPKGFTAATDLWNEMRPDSSASSLLGAGRFEVWPLALRAVLTMAGPGHLLAILLLPITTSGLGISAIVTRRHRPPLENGLRLCLVLLIVLSGLVLVVTPNVVETDAGTMNMLVGQYLPVRFGLCFLSLAVIGQAVFLNDLAATIRVWLLRFNRWRAWRMSRHGRSWDFLRETANYAMHVLLGSLFLYQFVLHFWKFVSLDFVILVWDIVALAAAVVLVRRRWPRVRTWIVSATAVLAVVGVAWACGWLASRWHQKFAQHYDQFFAVSVFSAVEQLEPSQERICVCEYRYYPFFGSRRQFSVCRPLWIPDQTSFLQYLASHRVTVVATRRGDFFPQGRYVGVPEWLTANTTAFAPLHEDSKYVMVRVDGAALPAAESISSMSSEERVP